MLSLIVESSKKTRSETISKNTEHELIERCKQGQISAFREIYEIHSVMLFSIAMRMLGIKEDAEDALQNCFINLHKSLSRFRGESKLSSYIVRILINCCYDILAKKNKIYRTEDEVMVRHQDELSLSLEKAIALLPLKMRECFILFAVEGFKQSEIAGMLQISEGAVKAHIFHARKKLRDFLS